MTLEFLLSRFPGERSARSELKGHTRNKKAPTRRFFLHMSKKITTFAAKLVDYDLYQSKVTLF